jgi:4-carboxymuconolactone decarboxylase
MTDRRYPALEDAQMTPDQRRVAKILTDGPRKGLPGPFHALLRSPELADRVRNLGDFVRFSSSVPAQLNELAIMMVARFLTAQYEWYAHRRLSAELGLAPAIADAIAEGRRPAALSADQAVVYDFCNELLNKKDVSDPIYAAALARFGETALIELVATVGYYSFVSMILNTVRMPLPADATPLRPL